MIKGRIKSVIENTRYKWYRHQWNKAGRGKLLPHPVHIDLELVKGCDAACSYCPASKSRHRRHMHTSSAIQWLSEARKSCYSVKLNWRGEAALHPDFLAILEHVGGLNFTDVMLNTNGMHGQVLHPAITTLAFSLDSLHQDVQSALRPGTVVKTIHHNIEWAVYQRDHHPSGNPKRLRVNFTECESNKNDKADVASFCHQRNIELIVRKEAPRNEGRITLPRKMCPFPFQRLTVAYDGRVYPCCVPWDGRNVIQVGHLRRDSFEDVWTGKAMALIRKDSKSVHYENPVCKTCTSYISYKEVL